MVLLASGLALLWSSTYARSVDLVRLWPVALILLGAEMLFAQSRACGGGQTVRFGLSGWALLFLALVLALGRGVAGPWLPGCAPEFGFAWQFGGQFPHRVTETVWLPLTLEGVSAVEIDVRVGRVELVAVAPGAEPRGEAVVTASARTADEARRAADAVSVTVQRIGSRLVVRAAGENPGGTTSRSQADELLNLPPGLEVRVGAEYGTVTAAGFAGPVEVKSRFGAVVLSSIGGAVTVETEHGALDARLIGGPLDVRSTYGKVTCDDVGGVLSIVSRHGNVSVRRARGPLEVETTYGKASVYYDAAPGAACDVTTVHGLITVEMPSSSPVTVDAASERAGVSTTSLSGLRAQSDGRRSRAEGDVNGGGPRVTLRTTYARIEIRGR